MALFTEEEKRELKEEFKKDIEEAKVWTYRLACYLTGVAIITLYNFFK